uniref:Transient receptor potential cation channel, subfamily V, member 1 n=1 Tax=Oncorhynchus kisutch TaxID=8019 RepID=A0A8C7ML82_ONCKI
MSKAMDLEYPTFSLETVDRKNDERAQSRQVKKPDHHGLRLTGGTGEGLEENNEEGALFEAVSTGNVMKLEGLVQYLHQSMKKLSNTEYQSYGKNTLLKALLNLRDGHAFSDCLSFLSLYHSGQTALHIAIERRSAYSVQLLIKEGAEVHAEACGKFFQHHDLLSFYCELTLPLAVCTNQSEVDDFLLENSYHWVDVRERDSLGNMVLHALVVVSTDNTPENMDFITSMWRLEDLDNNQCLTPIKLSAKFGKIREWDKFAAQMFFLTAYKRKKGTVRSFCMITIRYIILAETEQLSLDPGEHHAGDQISVAKVLSIETIFTSAQFLSLSDIHLAGQLFTAVEACHLFPGGVLSDKTRVQVDFVCSFLQTIFLSSSVLYCCGRVEYLGFFVLCLSLSRVTLCYFSRGYGHIGIYSVMINKMILGDILRFLFVYVVLCFGFSAGLSFLFCHFCMQGHKNTTRDVLLLISYIMLTYILLLNMLIAVMSRTVEKMSLESTSIWKLQRAITILDLERSLPCCLSRQLCSGVDKDLRTRAGEMDRRWCFRLPIYSVFGKYSDTFPFSTFCYITSSRVPLWRWEHLPEGQQSLQHPTNQVFMVEWPDGSHSSAKGT